MCHTHKCHTCDIPLVHCEEPSKQYNCFDQQSPAKACRTMSSSSAVRPRGITFNTHNIQPSANYFTDSPPGFILGCVVHIKNENGPKFTREDNSDG